MRYLLARYRRLDTLDRACLNTVGIVALTFAAQLVRAAL